MKKIFRFISILMITVIISTTTAAAYVQPVEAKATLINLAKKAAEAVFAELGKTFAEWSIDSVICNALESELQAMIESEQIVENDDGTITFSEEAIADLRALLDEYFAQEENVPDVVWMPVVRADEIPASNFYSTTLYYQMRSYMDEHDLAIFNWCLNRSSTAHMRVADVSDLFLYTQSGTDAAMELFDNASIKWANKWGSSFSDDYKYTEPLYFATLDGVGSKIYADGYYAKDGSGWVAYENDETWSYEFRSVYPWYACEFSTAVYGYLIASEDFEPRYIPIYRNIAAYKNFITGNADYYQLTPTYQGGDITVNPNIDYGQIYDAVSNAMKDSAANGENVTHQLSAMQDAYEATMQEISGTLGDIEDNTAQSNSWLEKIYNNTASIASILIEQFDAMTETISNGFASVVDGLSDVSLGLGEIGDSSGGGSDSDGGSKLSFWDRLGNFFGTTLGGVFDLISIIIMKALDGVGWLADKLIDNLGKALDGVSEIMDRYTKKITENNTLSKLGEAIPPELKDLFTFFFFGVIGAGIIRAAKK